MLFIRHGSQEDRSQSASRCICILLLLPSPARLSAGRHNQGLPCALTFRPYTYFVSFYGSHHFSLATSVRWDFRQTRMGEMCVLADLKAAFLVLFQALSAILPTSTGFRMSKTLSHSLLWVTIDSEGRVKPLPHLSLVSVQLFNIFIGKLS